MIGFLSRSVTGPIILNQLQLQVVRSQEQIQLAVWLIHGRGTSAEWLQDKMAEEAQALLIGRGERG